MDVTILLQPTLLISLPIGFAAKSAVTGWLAWTMWRQAPKTPLGRGLRGFYAWIMTTSITLTFVLGKLAWNAAHDDLSWGWLIVVLTLDATSLMTAYWGWRVRDHYIEMSQTVRNYYAREAAQDRREDELNARDEVRA
jgi:hypothetical protein